MLPEPQQPHEFRPVGGKPGREGVGGLWLECGWDSVGNGWLGWSGTNTLFLRICIHTAAGVARIVVFAPCRAAASRFGTGRRLACCCAAADRTPFRYSSMTWRRGWIYRGGSWGRLGHIQKHLAPVCCCLDPQGPSCCSTACEARPPILKRPPTSGAGWNASPAATSRSGRSDTRELNSPTRMGTLDWVGGGCQEVVAK
jgi:hypothetical protein